MLSLDGLFECFERNCKYLQSYWETNTYSRTATHQPRLNLSIWNQIPQNTEKQTQYKKLNDTRRVMTSEDSK
jgi:hypothetical protein